MQRKKIRSVAMFVDMTSGLSSNKSLKSLFPSAVTGPIEAVAEVGRLKSKTALHGNIRSALILKMPERG